MAGGLMPGMLALHFLALPVRGNLAAFLLVLPEGTVPGFLIVLPARTERPLCLSICSSVH